MFTANAFVIYFTLGVPFGVLSIYFNRSKIAAVKACWFAAYLAIWPFFAFRSFISFFSMARIPADRGNTIARQNDLRSRFISNFPDTIETVMLRKLLLELDRYIALSNALADVDGDAGPVRSPVHMIVEHPFPLIASKCARRKLQSKLSHHQIEAFRNLNRLLMDLGIELPTAISFELRTSFYRNSDDLSATSAAKDRLAA